MTTRTSTLANLYTPSIPGFFQRRSGRTYAQVLSDLGAEFMERDRRCLVQPKKALLCYPKEVGLFTEIYKMSFIGIFPTVDGITYEYGPDFNGLDIEFRADRMPPTLILVPDQEIWEECIMSLKRVGGYGAYNVNTSQYIPL